MNAEPTRDEPDDRIDEIIAEYLQAVEAGQRPDGQTLIDRYPEHADALREFLADRQQFARAAEVFKDDAVDPDAPTVNGVLHEPPDPMPGTFVRYFGDYELLQEIARGGMGVVYEARQISLNRTVALKMILSGQLATDAEVKRFAQEAEAAANLDHPNIVPIHEVGRYKGRHYFTMKLIDGGPLSEHLVRLNADLRAAAEMMVKIARAVDFAHRRGILHRDLKPANVLLDADDEPHVTDFGLAKRVDRQRDVTLTKPGGILGTPAYMAPEQAAGEKDLTTAADIYSLGGILYMLLTGRPPFSGATPLDTLRQLLEKDPKPPRALVASVPRDLETICLKCLEKDPQRRYASAGAMADEMQRWLDHEPIHARPVGAAGRLLRWCRRNPALAAATSLAAIVILTLSCIYYVNLRAEHGRTVAALKSERASRRQAVDQRERAKDALARGKYEQARAVLLSGASGRRWRVLELLREANALCSRSARAGGEATPPLPTAAQLRTVGIDALLQNDARAIARGELALSMPMALSANGRVLVTAYLPGATSWLGEYGPAVGASGGKPKIGVRMLDTATGKEIGRIADLGDFAMAAMRPVISHDGRTLAVVRGSEVQLLALPSGKRVKTLKLPDRPKTQPSGAKATSQPARMMMHTGAFSPDGKRFAAVHYRVDASSVVEVVLWDLDDGSARRLGSWKAQGLWGRIAISPSGRLIAVPDGAGTLRLIDVSSEPKVREVRLPMPTLGALTFSPDETLLALQCADRESDKSVLVLWDVAGGKEKRRLLAGAMRILLSGQVGFSPTGRRVAVGDQKGNVVIFDVETGQERRRFRTDHFVVTLVHWEGDGRHLITASMTGAFNRWELSDDAPVALLETGSEPFNQFAFSPDGRYMAISSWLAKGNARATRLVDLRSGQVDRRLPAAGRVVFREDGKQLAVWSFSGKLEIVVFDIATGDEVLRAERQKRGVSTIFSLQSVGFGPRGQLLTLRGKVGSIVVWDEAAGKPYATVPTTKEKTVWATLTGDARMLAYLLRTQAGTRFCAWDLRSKRPHTQFDIPDDLVPLNPQFSPDYRWTAMFYLSFNLAGPRGDGGDHSRPGVLLHSAARLGKPIRIHSRRMPGDIAFSPDSRLLAVTYLGGLIEVYALPSAELVFRLHMKVSEGMRVNITAAFTPDGKSLAIADGQSPIRLIHLDELNRELGKIGLGW